MTKPVFFIESHDAIELHDMIITRFGGMPGLRDSNLLDSALHQPLMMIEFGDTQDQSFHHLTAAYFFHLIKNHPFVDGNKRTGLLVALEFLSKNGFRIEMSFDALYTLALATAASEINRQEVALIFQKTIVLR